MQAQDTDDIFKFISDLFQANADFYLKFMRDESDSYIFEFECINEENKHLLTKKDVMPLLPIGADWIGAVGWRSLFGIPFKVRENEWIGIGLREILRHSHRGAYPVQITYFFPLSKKPIDELKRLATAISNERDYFYPFEKQSGMIEDDNPEEHAKFERKIIEKAYRNYEENKSMMFNTLVLSNSEIEIAASPENAYQKNFYAFEHFLIGIIPKLLPKRTWKKVIKEKLHPIIRPLYEVVQYILSDK